MIEWVKIKSGDGWMQEGIECRPSAVTIFVGPNNSGKSQILGELTTFCNEGTKMAGFVLIEDARFRTPSKVEARKLIEEMILTPAAKEVVPPNHIVVNMARKNRKIVPEGMLEQIVRDASGEQSRQYAKYFVRGQLLKLDGEGRAQLINEKPRGDLLREPSNAFQRMFKDDGLREQIRGIVYDAFGKYLVVDSSSNNLRLRLADEPPGDLERSLSTEALEYFEKTAEMNAVSDGVKAFVGMVVAVLASDAKVMFIDEPEAFLHPALSFKLGRQLATAAMAEGKQVFASTHSATFVMGCLQAGVGVNIVRLTYDGENGHARLLANEQLVRMMRHPLLRSTGVVSGLFYDNVVVTEGDSDRAFYQEINERLVSFDTRRGIPQCLFLNAQNKHTVPIIVEPLRRLGIATAGIVDIDVVKDGGKVWGRLAQGIGIPAPERRVTGELRQGVCRMLEATQKDMTREGGISLLAGSERATAENLCEKLEEYGLFVVRNGELQSWLAHLRCAGRKESWLPNVFEQMGEDPEQEGYLKPARDDVWNVIDRVRQWLVRPGRKGMEIDPADV